MAQRVEHFSVAVDANGETLEYLAFAGGDGTVTAVDVHFPSGCVNRVGAQVFYAQAQVIPRTANEYLRGNDQTRRFELSSFPTGSSWAVFLDSTDLYAHTIRLDFEIDELVAGEGNLLGLPPVVLFNLDETLPGIVERYDLSAFTLPTGSGLPVVPGVAPAPTGASGSQAELDGLRLALASASSPQMAADIQARIAQLVALGFR